MLSAYLCFILTIGVVAMKFMLSVALLVGLDHDATASPALTSFQNALRHGGLNNYTETSAISIIRVTKTLGVPATRLAELSKLRKSILKSHLQGESILSTRSETKVIEGLVILRGEYPQYGVFIDRIVAELPDVMGKDRLLRKLLRRYEASFTLIREVLRISDMSVEGLERFSGLEHGVLRSHMHREETVLASEDLAKLLRGINDLKKHYPYYISVLDEIVKTLPKSIEVEKILQIAPQGFPQQLLERAIATRDEAILEWKESPELFTDFWRQGTRIGGEKPAS